jgi:hypothetical protein
LPEKNLIKRSAKTVVKLLFLVTGWSCVSYLSSAVGKAD